VPELSASLPESYNQIFSYVDVTEDPNNPGNTDANSGFPTLTNYFPRTYIDYQAVQACSDKTALKSGQ